MGFDYDIATFALTKTSYVSEARALSYLMDKEENGKYEHPFIGYNESVC
jgi:hypothetical protein